MELTLLLPIVVLFVAVAVAVGAGAWALTDPQLLQQRLSTVALKPAMAMPNQRANSPPRMTEKQATSCSTPSRSVTQPHVFSSANTYLASWTKNVDLSIAAIP